jgi:hypothetical protein
MVDVCNRRENESPSDRDPKGSMSTTFKPEKLDFTDAEVAQQLGISLERLHALLDLNVFNDGSEKPAKINFRPQDLVMIGIWHKTTPENLLPMRRRTPLTQ